MADATSKYLNSLKKMSQIKQFTKNEISKLKLKDETNRADEEFNLVVQSNEEAIDQRLEEEKQKLTRNLSQIMTAERAQEILNDESLVNPMNIIQINENFSNLIKSIKQKYKTITIDAFKKFLSMFIRKLNEPDNEETRLGKIETIISMLKNKDENLKYGPQIEKISIALQKRGINLDGETLDELLYKIENDDLNTVFLQDISQNIGSSAASSSGGIKNIPLEDWYTNQEVLSMLQGKTRNSASISQVKKKVKENFELQPTTEALVFLNSLSEAEKEQFLKSVSELRDRASNEKTVKNEDILKDINPYNVKYKNFKVKQFMTQGLTEKQAKTKANIESSQLFGWGMKPSKESKQTRKEELVKFGVLQLNLDKLANNHLKLSYVNNNMVKEIPLTKISNEFKNMIKDILNGKKHSETKFNKLSEEEKHLYKMVLKKTRLYADLDVPLHNLTSSHIDKLKNEFNIILGQINSGNDNPELKARAKQLINEFIKKKIISKNEGVNILLNL